MLTCSAACAATPRRAQKAALMEAETRRPRIAILGSTRGTNTLHIYAEIAAGRLRAEVAVAIGGDAICAPPFVCPSNKITTGA